MTLYLALTLVVLGLTGGVFSGWLGIGGGIIMAPLLLYVPAAIGAGVLDMKVVAGLTVMQSLFATGSGALAHRRMQHVSRPLVLWMGTGITAGSLAGALYSKYLDANALLAIFAALALLAAMMMLLPYREAEREPRAMDVTFNQPLALLLGLVLGSASGLVGQSGAFIIIPAMLYILKIPTRTTIGSSLGIVFLAALAGSVGKMATSQIDFTMALFCVSGAMAGSLLGSKLSAHTKRKHLRRVLSVIIALTAARMAWDVTMG